MGCTACTEPQDLYRGALYLYLTYFLAYVKVYCVVVVIIIIIVVVIIIIVIVAIFKYSQPPT